MISREGARSILGEGMSLVESLAAQLDDESFVMPKTIGGGDWSVKDLVGHLAYWQEIALTALDDIRAGKKPEIEDAFARARKASMSSTRSIKRGRRRSPKPSFRRAHARPMLHSSQRSRR